MTGMPRRPRRPDHWASAHERARSRAAERLDAPLDPDEAAWLDRHLADCPDCRAIAAAYEADRAALRSLRDLPIEPPRDLWARTAAGIEREASRRGGGPRRATRRAGGPRFPVGALAGVMVVVVLVGLAAVSGRWLDGSVLLPGGSPSVADASASGDLPIGPPATPITVAAGNVTWIHSVSGGGYAYNVSSVDHVCPVEDQPGCASLAEGPPEHVDLGSAPRTIIGSPTDHQAVVVGPDGSGSDKLFVVSLPEVPRQTAKPTTSPASATPKVTPTAGAATATPAAPSSTPDTSAGPSDEPSPSAVVASTEPTTSPVAPTSTPSASATPEATPTDTAPSDSPSPSPLETPVVTASPQATASAIAIATGVTVVGQSAAFSADGRWFAFTARPADGSAGPDIYVWHMGDATAKRLTNDGGSVFASWAGDDIVGSRIGSDGSASGEHAPTSFVLDPQTGADRGDTIALWRPVVDPSARFAVAWDGTVRADDTGTTLTPGQGQLVITSWRPDANAVATRSLVPGGEAAIADLDVRWDQTGDWVAIWTADPSDPSIGRLSLYRLDAATGSLERAKGAPRDVPALPGFSIGDGRLAWVTPHGQDAEGSKVQVVAWSGDGVGAVESVPADGVVVVR